MRRGRGQFKVLDRTKWIRIVKAILYTSDSYKVIGDKVGVGHDTVRDMAKGLKREGFTVPYRPGAGRPKKRY